MNHNFLQFLIEPKDGKSILNRYMKLYSSAISWRYVKNIYRTDITWRSRCGHFSR